MDEPQGRVTPAVVERWFWLWDAYILGTYLIAVVVTLDDETSTGRRVAAIGALTFVALWYALFGRRVILAGEEGWPARWFVIGALVGFCVSLALEPRNSLVLFMLYPMIFMAVPLRVSVPVVVGASLLQIVLLLTNATREELVIPPIVGMVISVLMGTFIDRTVNESQRRAELIERLEASQAAVAKLSHEAGVAVERARLAREIHDTLAQGFTSIVTLVQAAESELDGEPDKARAHLRLAARTARENLDEARTLVAALTPSALDNGSLDDAIRRQVERLGEETGIEARYRTVGETGELPTVLEVVLLRAVQEALSNVRRHAGASSVNVALRFTEDAVVLAVADDGAGFARGAEGFGLAGMRARAEQVSGRLVVHSAPGKGTRLELEVPR